MAFKLILTQAQLDALTDAHKALYVKSDKDGNYHLDVDPEDIPDVDGLKKKNNELLEEKKAEQRKREEAEREAAKKAGDVGALETSWATRLDTETGALKAEIATRDTQLARLTVGRAATEIAAELAVVTNGVSSAKALLPHIERRLQMEMVAGEVRVRVMDAAGKPSAMTLDQLKDEFRADPVFAPLIQASKANGSGGDGGKNNNGGGGSKAYAEMSETERKELHRTDPAKFQKLQADFRAATQRR